MQTCDELLTRAQTAQHGCIIEMTGHVPACCHGDCDTGEHHGDQCREAEKTVGTIECGTDLRPRIGCRFEALTTSKLRAQRVGQVSDRCGITCCHQSIGDARTGLDEFGRRQIGECDKHLGCRVEIVEHGIRFLQHQCRQVQRAAAECDGVADGNTECFGTRARQPDCSWLRRALMCALVAAGIAQPITAAQGIVQPECTHIGEAQILTRTHHAVEAPDFAATQPRVVSQQPQ